MTNDEIEKKMEELHAELGKWEEKKAMGQVMDMCDWQNWVVLLDKTMELDSVRYIQGDIKAKGKKEPFRVISFEVLVDKKFEKIQFINLECGVLYSINDKEKEELCLNALAKITMDTIRKEKLKIITGLAK